MKSPKRNSFIVSMFRLSDRQVIASLVLIGGAVVGVVGLAVKGLICLLS